MNKEKIDIKSKKYNILQKVKRSLLRITVALICVFIICYTVYYIWTPGLIVQNGRHDLKKNGIWLQHGWLGDDSWFQRNGRDPKRFRNDKRIKKLAKLLKENNIKYLFPHLCPCESNGMIAKVDPLQTEKFLDSFKNSSLIPWVGGVLNVHCFPESKQWRGNFTSSIVTLLKDHPRLAGIQINIEPMPSGNKNLLILLDELRIAMPNDKILSIAAYPPPTKWHPFPRVHWEKSYFKEVASRVDQIVPMMYDTGIKLSKFYQELMCKWTLDIVEWAGDTQVLFGIPAYNDAGSGYHYPNVENLENALLGIHSGLSHYKKLPSNYAGISIYCEWEMNQEKWKSFKREFSKDCTKSSDSDAIYIWNRNWKPVELQQSIKSDERRDYYFLSREFSNSKIERIYPKKYFFMLQNRVIPVFRIHLKTFKKYIKTPEKLAEKIICEFRKVQNSYLEHKNGQSTNNDISNPISLAASSKMGIDELQLDLDCPESKLAKYADLLRCVRAKIPTGCKLSFTALPCHLKNSAFKKVAQFADYYVLQVHGLEFPKTIEDHASILNLRIAQKAIQDAESLKIKYILALPTYAYQLNFERKSGEFLFLNAEKIPPKNSEIIIKIIAPDFKDITELIKEVRNSQKQYCKGVIWFRLPVKGDRLNLDSATLATLQEGNIPKKEITTEWKKDKNGTINLFIVNRGILKSGTFKITMKWENNNGIFDLFRGFNSGGVERISELPSSIVGDIPSPEKSTPVGWFRSDKQIIPITKLEWNL